MQNVIAILSMLHEEPARNSATRTFRDEPVLAWTLERLSRAQSVGHMAILCWQDQLEHVTPVAEEHGACVLSKDPRISIASLQSITAARRWADAWRGGLLGACDCDLGFHGLWVKEIMQQLDGDATMLVDPSAGLVDATLIDRLVDHARAHESVQICFTQSAPGLAGVLLRPDLLEQLAVGGLHAGKILGYLPDQPVRDPISGDGCVQVPAPIARTTRSFKLDSDRQIARITEAAVNLNGELLASDALELLNRLNWSNHVDPLPREVVVELGCRRLCNPIFWAGRFHKITRQALTRDLAQKIFGEIAQADDARLTLAGVGDPLVHPEFASIIELATRAGVHAIHVETDLLSRDTALIDQLAELEVDVISVHLPAVTAKVYQDVMGVSGIEIVLENIRRLVARRQARGKGTPLIVPIFTKCEQNLAEMEQWYDQWLGALGSAVIAGPSDFCGQIPSSGVADMSPAMRRACARLSARMTVLSDGTAVACEQDVLARHAVGNLKFDSIAVVWNRGMQPLRQLHSAGQFAGNPLCAACREWHRP